MTCACVIGDVERPENMSTSSYWFSPCDLGQNLAESKVWYCIYWKSFLFSQMNRLDASEGKAHFCLSYLTKIIYVILKQGQIQQFINKEGGYGHTFNHRMVANVNYSKFKISAY